MKKLNIFISPLIIIPLIMYIYYYNEKPDIKLKKNLTPEINSKVNEQDYIKSIKKGKILTKDKEINTSKLGKQKITIEVENNLKRKMTYYYHIDVKDTTIPEIQNVKDLTTTEGKKLNLLDNITVKDNSNEKITPTIEGDYDFNKVGEYKLTYVAKDSSGNTAKENFKLTVNKKPVPKATATTYTNVKVQEGFPYYIKVNKTNNVVIVYGEKDGYYNNVVKVFTVSPGNNTPVGTFKTKAKYQWQQLEGKVWGQYATRISGHYLFHSVPYYKHNKYTIETKEYNLLGVKRSMGCIRLTVIDSKWIYDNCPIGTTVEIYNGPLVGISKPETPKIPAGTPYPKSGWDPTDPDPANPWK